MINSIYDYDKDFLENKKISSFSHEINTRKYFF